MYKVIKNYGWTIWLGGALNIFNNGNFMNWEYWVYVIPLILLVAWSKY
jgi:hypothetical protein